jgi:rhodanese-related sulfurtransferase
MLEQILEFVVNHWLLTSIWVVLFILLMRNEGARGGAALSTAQVTQLINKEDAKVVDIRAKDEFKTGHLPDAINIPAKDMPKRMTELDAFKDVPIILICKTGTTAGATGSLLTKAGFTKLNKLRGGILEWQGSNLPLVKG